MYIHVAVSFAVQQKLTQCCKYIPIKINTDFYFLKKKKSKAPGSQNLLQGADKRHLKCSGVYQVSLKILPS